MVDKSIFKLSQLHVRLGIAFLVLLTMAVLFSPQIVGVPTIVVGTPSPVDITSSKSFEYINQQGTDDKIMLALRQLSPVFKYDPMSFKTTEDDINRFQVEMNTLNYNDTVVAAEFNEKYDWTFKKEQDKDIRSNIEDIAQLLKYIAKFVYDAGLTESSEIEKSLQFNISSMALVVDKDGDERSVDISDIFTLENVEGKMAEELSRVKPGLNDDEKKWIVKFIIKRLKPNIALDTDKTIERIEAIKKSVEPVYGKVQEDESIVRQGALVTQNVMQKVNAYKNSLQRDRLHGVINGLLFGMLFLLASGLYLYRFQKNIFEDNIQMITLTLVVIIFLMTYIMVQTVFSDSPNYLLLVPLSAFTISIAVLINQDVALILTLMLVGVIAVLSGGLVEIPIILSLGSLTTIYRLTPSKRVKNRMDIFWATFWACLLQSFAIFVFNYARGIENEYHIRLLVNQLTWSALSCVIFSPMLALFLLTVFESLFQIPTHFKLLEYSQLNAPVFRDMFVKAPGTYQHTMNVANLAELAADRIGADPLLARVGAYYHDIGKISKPEYFTENQVDGKNKHDDIKPTLSASVLKAHVKDGILLAKKLKLPQKIIDFIPEHHGKSTMQSFFVKAMNDPDMNDVDKSEFQYQGPNPRSKETAIVMLSDSIEALSRSMEKPNMNVIQSKVREIINNKFTEGILNETNLTLRDLNLLADSFIESLNSMHHTRERYPDSEEIKNAEARNIKKEQ